MMSPDARGYLVVHKGSKPAVVVDQTHVCHVQNIGLFGPERQIAKSTALRVSSEGPVIGISAGTVISVGSEFEASSRPFAAELKSLVVVDKGSSSVVRCRRC